MSSSYDLARRRLAISMPTPITPASPKRPATVKVPATAPSSKKPEGISRELYALIGPSAPSLSLAANLAKPRLKQKPNFNGRGAAKWEWRPFRHPARGDSLQLNHWVKANEPDNGNISHTEYDLRWYVIHDRYEFPGGPSTRNRGEYSFCCRKLIRTKSQLLNNYQFDKEREKMRKNYIASLEERTQEEGCPDIVAEEEGPASFSTDSLKKKKKGTMDVDFPSTPTNVVSLGPPATKATPVRKGSHEKHCILRVEPPASATTKTTHVPVHLRSLKLLNLKGTIAQKVTEALEEIGFKYPPRLVMPTRENCAKTESLLGATTALIDTKRIVDKVDQDIRVLRARLGLRESEVTDGDARESMQMDIDESKDGSANKEGEVDGRAQSVSRRSMSASSMDTSASTRTGTKRQKRG
ncbi:hypothetical protein EDD16DRAFT_1689708 [Pisolithus croceorrhizus]|nr:hypothetical protein EDD16DRAFT_1689708 [Pisolithus croceorrhizus]